MAQPVNYPNSIIETALELLEVRDGVLWMLAKGDSMYPLVCTGDLLRVQPVKELPQRGDILVFHYGNVLAAHRLLDLRQNQQGLVTSQTQGDHALHPDPPMAMEQVISRAIALQRQGQELHLDTPPWRRIGRAVSTLQYIFLRVEDRTRPGIFVHRLTRACITLFLELYLNAVKR